MPSGKEEILKHLLTTASEKWSPERAAQIRPSLEAAADAIWKIENFQLKPDEQPEHPTLIFHQWNSRKKTAAEK
jgi:hypothetical protein